MIAIASNPALHPIGGQPAPLASMTKLSDSVLLTRPSSSPPPDHPKLILLLGWVSAADTHLSRYINNYATLCPHTPILLIKARVPIMGSPNLAARDVAPAIPVIRSTFEAENSLRQTKADLHIHAFSNGGSNLLHTLQRLYAPALLPLHTTLFDSTPSTTFRYHQIVLSIATSLPRSLVTTLALPLIHFLVLAFWIWIYAFGGTDPYAQWSSSHNNPETVREEARVYIYSDVDALVSACDVEAHAREAEARKFKVRREVFIGSRHVAHARSEGGRYWRIVREVLGVGERGVGGWGVSS